MGGDGWAGDRPAPSPSFSPSHEDVRQSLPGKGRRLQHAALCLAIKNQQKNRRRGEPACCGRTAPSRGLRSAERNPPAAKSNPRGTQENGPGGPRTPRKPPAPPGETLVLRTAGSGTAPARIASLQQRFHTRVLLLASLRALHVVPPCCQRCPAEGSPSEGRGTGRSCPAP